MNKGIRTLLTLLGIFFTLSSEPVDLSLDSAYLPVTVNVDAVITAEYVGLDIPAYQCTLSSESQQNLVLPLNPTTSVHENGQTVSPFEIQLFRIGKDVLVKIPVSFEGSLYLYSFAGRELGTVSFTSKRNNHITLPAVPMGIYLLKMRDRNGVVFTEKITAFGGEIEISNEMHSYQNPSSIKTRRAAGDSATYRFTIQPTNIAYIDSSFELTVTAQLNPARRYDLPFHINSKKGVCKTTKTEGWHTIVSSLQPSWHYSWGWELKAEEPGGVQFVPMIWGGGEKIDEYITYLSGLKDEGKLPFLLGFNEPDGADQANLSVDEAIALWPKLESLGVPLGSPAAVNALNEWMVAFMEKVKQNDLRVDFITVHHYGGTNADGFMNKLDAIYTEYGLPIWITEFAAADWNATTIGEHKYTPEDVLTYMKEILPRLDTTNYVHRYAWFSFQQTSVPGWPSALYDSTGQLTPLGEYYAGY